MQRSRDTAHAHVTVPDNR